MTTAPMVDYKIHWLKMMSVPESRAVVGRHDGINGRDNAFPWSLRFLLGRVAWKAWLTVGACDDSRDEVADSYMSFWHPAAMRARDCPSDEQLSPGDPDFGLSSDHLRRSKASIARSITNWFAAKRFHGRPTRSVPTARIARGCAWRLSFS